MGAKGNARPTSRSEEAPMDHTVKHNTQVTGSGLGANKVRSSDSSRFLKDVQDLFIGCRDSHLGPYLYGDPLAEYLSDSVDGANLWNNMTVDDGRYYLLKSEAALIESKASDVAKASGRGIDFVDLGVGSESSFRAKTRPFLENLDVRRYYPVDLCSSYLNSVTITVHQQFPTLEVIASCVDFLDFPTAPEGVETPFLFIGGSTILNLPLSNRTEPPKQNFINAFAQTLTHWRNTFGTVPVLMTIDENQEQSSLLAAYDTAANASFSLNFIERVNRDLPITGLDRSGFQFQAIWNHQQSCIEHTLISTTKHQIVLNKMSLEIEEGKRFVIDRSFKLNESEMRSLFRVTGSNILDIFRVPQNPMVLYLIELS